MDSRPKTIICDIDGTLCEHSIPTLNTNATTELKILPGTIDKLSEWDAKGYNIILITGRRESMRASTESQLAEAGIFYDQLIMGVGGGLRVLINDNKPNGDLAAMCINIKRNEGINNINI
jgi:hydroxymethylpyrimidine pyrophosphatase-like HAD family hydrolase